jgi:hypothetical protein
MRFCALAALYLVAMFHMPNRAYYAQFVGLDAANLNQTVTSVLLFTAVELASVVLFHMSLLGMLRISPIHQLAFVLRQDAVHVQSMLVLWVVYSTQASLDHFGACRDSRWCRPQTGTNAVLQWPLLKATTTRSGSSG